MCFYFKASKEVLGMLEKKYEGIGDVIRSIKTKNDGDNWEYNGFSHPDTPVVLSANPALVTLANWGLIPYWAKDRTIQDNTLNAKIETISEKPSFKYSLNNRCLVFADGFYEWQWLDTKGKEKQKYLLTLHDNEPFAFAGLWNAWTDKDTCQIIKTYTILTTEANELMSEIHNSKKRMPVILSPDVEKDWLLGSELKMQNDRIVALRL
jgi:putative SOS response-associated peptidase YedK